MKKNITIKIPCYNCVETVLNSWMSITRQTIGIENLQCIFVDDASDDNGETLKKLTEIEAQARDSVLIIKLDVNMRQGGARNIGLEYAEGEYIQFLDSDDMLREDACQLLYDLAEEKQADIIQFNHLFRLGRDEKISEASSVRQDIIINNRIERIPLLNSTIVTYGCTNKFYRTDLIRRANAKFAEHRIYEEPLFVYPLFLYAKRISIITEACTFCGVFFCETICFANQNSNTALPLEYFHDMQEVCRKVFPDWRTNPQMQNVGWEVKEVLEGIDRTFDSQDELDEKMRLR